MSANTHRNPLSVAFVGQPHRRRLGLAPVVVLAALAVAAVAAAAPKVAVLDIRASVGGAPPDFGTTAARLVAAAFLGTGKYQVVDYGLVRDELAKRNLRPPFGVGHLQLLADVLKADLVVHGSVRSLTYDAQQRSASVVLALELVDGPSGNLRKRAEATGALRASDEADQGLLMVGALTDAANRAVESVTGLKVQAETPKVTVPAAEEVPGMAVPVGDGSPATVGALPALLPPAEVGDTTPRTTTPEPDLRPGAPPGPKVSVIVVPRPQTGGGAAPSAPAGAAGAPGETPTTSGTVTVLPEPPAEEPVAEEAIDEGVVPLIQVKVLAKTAPDRVLVTLGKGGAVTPKMEMDVYRVTVARDESVTRRKLGRIRVVKINPTDAEARILEGGPLMATGDYAYYYGE